MSTTDVLPLGSQENFEIPVRLFAMDGTREAISARIRRVSSGFFQLRTTLAVDVGKKLVMAWETCRVELEVVYCQRPELGGCYVGARVLSTEGSAFVRKEARLPVDIPAAVSVPGVFDHEKALVIDVSSSGLGLMLPMAVEPGSMIAIDIGRGIVFGEVRHCSKMSAVRFLAGTTIEEFISRDQPHALENEGGQFHSLLVLLKRLKNSILPSKSERK